jgi:hypothetical protein
MGSFYVNDGTDTLMDFIIPADAVDRTLYPPLVSADYNTGVVSISLGGACGTCSLTGTTLEDGVKRILTQRLDWVTEVVGVIDTSEEFEGTGNWRPYKL